MSQKQMSAFRAPCYTFIETYDRSICQAENLPDVLVYARTGNGMMQRRGGLAYARENMRLQTHFYKSGFLTFPEYISNCAVRVAASILPVGIRGYLYQKKLRERMHA